MKKSKAETLAEALGKPHQVIDLNALQGHLRAQDALIGELVEALQLTRRLCDEALPKFNWGASALGGNAIDLLNRTPRKVSEALAKAEAAR